MSGLARPAVKEVTSAFIVMLKVRVDLEKSPTKRDPGIRAREARWYKIRLTNVTSAASVQTAASVQRHRPHVCQTAV